MRTGSVSDDLEVLTLPDAAAWESWLRIHHRDRRGVWLRIARKGSAVRSVTAAEGTEVALCFGWIDGHRKAADGGWFLQKYTPRRRGSTWSMINKDRAEALIRAGRMHEAGLAEIAAARADGRWAAAYESQRTATLPPDLAAALEASPRARERFDAMSRTDRYLVILRLLKARSPDERATRLARAIRLLEGGPGR